jgi:Na+/H+ antiporter NhaD/arsenite permease-like protein
MKTSLLLFFATAITLAFAAAKMVNLGEILQIYPWGILLILISLEIFTNMVINTRVMEVAAVWLSQKSKAEQTLVMALFSALLFFTSSLINNITAVMVVLPVVFVLLQAMKLDSRFGMTFFALLLAISNIAGASTPIGDFPAIIIMKSGLTTFPDYLRRAFPLFLSTAVFMVLIHFLRFKMQGREESSTERAQRELSVHFLALQHKNYTIQNSALLRIVVVFVVMFLAWSLLPAQEYPPETIAVAGLACAAVLLLRQGAKTLLEPYPLEAVLVIGPFLLLATVAQQLGFLDVIAKLILLLKDYPTLLLIAMMIVTAVLTGFFSAGPTAAAMMPVVIKVAAEVFPDQTHWLAIAFAASICAGSSLFITSASAGPLFMKKIADASLTTTEGKPLTLGFGSYARYGVLHFAIQLLVGITWVVIAMDSSK